jgi:hypothetical protein
MKASDATPVISDRARTEREIEFIAAPPIASPRSGLREIKVNLRFPHEHSKTEISGSAHVRMMCRRNSRDVWPRSFGPQTARLGESYSDVI